MNFYALFAVLAVAIASYECNRLNSFQESINDDRIVGGKPANAGQFPYMAALRTLLPKSDGSIFWYQRCGGGILSRRWIVTCAHCTELDSLNLTHLAIAVGARHISDDGKIYRLDRIVNHPSCIRKSKTQKRYQFIANNSKHSIQRSRSAGFTEEAIRRC